MAVTPIESSSSSVSTKPTVEVSKNSADPALDKLRKRAAASNLSLSDDQLMQMLTAQRAIKAKTAEQKKTAQDNQQTRTKSGVQDAAAQARLKQQATLTGRSENSRDTAGKTPEERRDIASKPMGEHVALPAPESRPATSSEIKDFVRNYEQESLSGMLRDPAASASVDTSDPALNLVFRSFGLSSGTEAVSGSVWGPEAMAVLNIFAKLILAAKIGATNQAKQSMFEARQLNIGEYELKKTKLDADQKFGVANALSGLVSSAAQVTDQVLKDRTNSVTGDYRDSTRGIYNPALDYIGERAGDEQRNFIRPGAALNAKLRAEIESSGNGNAGAARGPVRGGAGGPRQPDAARKSEVLGNFRGQLTPTELQALPPNKQKEYRALIDNKRSATGLSSQYGCLIVERDWLRHQAQLLRKNGNATGALALEVRANEFGGQINALRALIQQNGKTFLSPTHLAIAMEDWFGDVKSRKAEYNRLEELRKEEQALIQECDAHPPGSAKHIQAEERLHDVRHGTPNAKGKIVVDGIEQLEQKKPKLLGQFVEYLAQPIGTDIAMANAYESHAENFEGAIKGGDRAKALAALSTDAPDLSVLQAKRISRSGELEKQKNKLKTVHSENTDKVRASKQKELKKAKDERGRPFADDVQQAKLAQFMKAREDSHLADCAKLQGDQDDIKELGDALDKARDKVEANPGDAAARKELANCVKLALAGDVGAALAGAKKRMLELRANPPADPRDAIRAEYKFKKLCELVGIKPEDVPLVGDIAARGDLDIEDLDAEHHGDLDIEDAGAPAAAHPDADELEGDATLRVRPAAPAPEGGPALRIRDPRAAPEGDPALRIKPAAANPRMVIRDAANPAPDPALEVENLGAPQGASHEDYEDFLAKLEGMNEARVIFKDCAKNVDKIDSPFGKFDPGLLTQQMYTYLVPFKDLSTYQEDPISLQQGPTFNNAMMILFAFQSQLARANQDSQVLIDSLSKYLRALG